MPLAGERTGGRAAVLAGWVGVTFGVVMLWESIHASRRRSHDLRKEISEAKVVRSVAPKLLGHWSVPRMGQRA
jgi:hypothetical protein